MLRSRCFILTVLAVLLASAGCVKIQNTLRLNEDGSGYVKEMIKFGPKLLTLEKQLDLPFKIEDCLSDEAVKERASQMGKGVKVKEKKVVDTPDGGKKLTVTYTFPEINDLTLCMYPLGKEWNKYRLKFSYSTSGTLNQVRFNVIYENHVKHGITHTGRGARPEPELELQKVRKLLPIYKDMLEGLHLSTKIEIFDLNKWASVKRGWIGGGTPWYVRNGGRITLFEITDKILYTNDDALMVVLPWRQEGGERIMNDLLDFSYAKPGYHRVLGFDWSYTQFSTWREFH